LSDKNIILEKYKKNIYTSIDVSSFFDYHDPLKIITTLIEHHEYKKTIIHNFIIILFSLGKLEIINKMESLYLNSFSNIYKEENSYAAFSAAITNNHIETVKYLLDKKVPFFNNSIELTIYRDNIVLLKLLLNNFSPLSDFYYTKYLLLSADLKKTNFLSFFVLMPQFKELSELKLSVINESYEKEIRAILNLSQF